MRCPKCGFNSFDHLEACKKCGKDLADYKNKFNIKSVLLAGGISEEEKPVEVEESLEIDVAIPPETGSGPGATIEEPAEESDDLNFGFMENSDKNPEPLFDKLFEETLPDPQAEADDFFLDDGLDDPSAFDLDDPKREETDLGLTKDESSDKEGSMETNLGLDRNPDDPFLSGKKTDDEEEIDRPFDYTEALQTEELPSTSEEYSSPDSEVQKELFTDNLELPPLPRELSTDETLEPSFGKGNLKQQPAGTSDSFSLGALPDLESSDSQKAEKEKGFSEHPPPAAPPFGRRIVAFFCDMVLLGLVSFCFIVVAETALSEKPDGLFPTLSTLIDLSIPYFLVVFCLTFGYFTLFHFLAGQTPGKMLTSVQVETITGESLAFSQAFMRSIGGLIQVLPVGLGYLTVLINKEGRGWNDQLAGTRLTDLKSLADQELNAESDEFVTT